MVKIIIDNVYTRIEGASQDIELAIWHKLSFQVEEFQSEHIRYRHLFNRKTKKTYTGLLDFVIKILNKHNEEYEIRDTRVKHEPNANFKLVDYITLGSGDKKKLEARPYQQEIVNRAEARECIQCATGGG